jgi:hypothetical protein
LNKLKLLSNIYNTGFTILFSYLVFGLYGIIISFVPDIMMIFIISDLWQKNPKDKLTGIKLHIHLFLHSYTFVIIIFVMAIVMNQLSLDSLYIIVCVIFFIHITFDYMTHSKVYNEYFICYYPLYPYRRIKASVD